MVAIVTRAGKGSPLTNAEVDANFDNLNNGKVETTFAGVVAALGYTPYKANDNVIFGTLTAAGQVSLGGAAGAEGLRVLSTASSVNWIQAAGSLAGANPQLSAQGSDTNIVLEVASKGNAGVSLRSNGARQFMTSSTANAVNYVQAIASVAGAGASSLAAISFTGSDAAVNGAIITKGTGYFAVAGSGSSANQAFRVLAGTGSGTGNLLAVSGAAAGASPSIAAISGASGTDANIDILLLPKGTGVTRSNGNEVLTTASTYAGTLTSGQVTTALGYTPLNPTTSQTANTFYAAPGGAAGAPTFRALVSADLPTYTGTLTSGQVTTALGFTPYNATNPSGYITNTGNARVGVENNGTLVGTRRNINFIPGTGISYTIADDSANEEVDVTITNGGVTSFNTRTGAVTLSSSDVTTALGFTPYNSTNPNGYITSSGSISGNAATATTATNWGSYGGVPAAGTSFGNANTIGRSDASGYTYFNYINSNTANNENPGVSQVIVTNGSDNFYRKASIGHLTGSLSGTAPINVTGSAGSSNLANAKWQSAAIAGSQGSNVSAVEVRNNGGTGDANLANITFHCQGQYGTSLHLRPDGFFGVGGWSASTWRWYVSLSSGDMVAAGNVTAYSDERLKKDWGALPDDFIEQLAAVRHGTYTRIDSGARQVGVSAQSLQRLLPEAVGVGEDGDTLQVAYGNAALASAVQLAKELIHTRDRVAQLEAKLAKISGEG